jgi:ABC-type dipeptide/oligopeptide/nickel transport system ATPase component
MKSSITRTTDLLINELSSCYIIGGQKEVDKNQKKLIILQGNSGVGKTTTLQNTIRELVSDYDFLITEEEAGRNDRRVVLKHRSGLLVSICTSGDTLEIIEGNYRFFISHCCDVMISACRINTETHLDNSRTNLMKTALIGFASGYWESDEVHFNADSANVKQLTILSQEEEDIMMDKIIQEISIIKQLYLITWR